MTLDILENKLRRDMVTFKKSLKGPEYKTFLQETTKRKVLNEITSIHK